MSVGNVDGGDWFEKSADHQVHKAEVEDFYQYVTNITHEWLIEKLVKEG